MNPFIREPTGPLQSMLLGLNLRVLARTLVAMALAFAVLGVLANTFPETAAFRVFNLDREGVPPALYSAALPAAGALVALLVAGHVSLRLPATTTAIGLAFLSLDELAGVHERLEGLTGIDWQLLYVPLAVGFALGWIGLVRWARRTTRSASTALLGGAAMWAVSQVLEMLEWSSDVKVSGYSYFMVPEEILEMVGSISLLVGLILIYRALPHDTDVLNSEPTS